MDWHRQMLYVDAIKIADDGNERQIWIDMDWEHRRLRNDRPDEWRYVTNNKHENLRAGLIHIFANSLAD